MSWQIRRIPLDLTTDTSVIKCKVDCDILTLVDATSGIPSGMLAYLNQPVIELIVTENTESKDIDITIICMQLDPDVPSKIIDPLFTRHIGTLVLDGEVYSFGYTIPESLRETDES
jgi:hypothetical protein